MKPRKVQIYDTTLRDGSQKVGVSFSCEDKLKIVKELDRFGIHYIEGGWPQPQFNKEKNLDNEFFNQATKLKLKNAKLVAFGSTCRVGLKPESDPLVRHLTKIASDVVTIVGKSWDFQVKRVLRTSLSENLRIIRETIYFLKRYFGEVFFDGEHFFDGFKDNPRYALETLKTAAEAGAGVLVLCDTNGGSLPREVYDITKRVREKLNAPLGIHAHNDSDCAVANSLAAVEAGATQVQGTINGYGERCGNANLCSIIPNLSLKLKIATIPKNKLRMLREVSNFICELANLNPYDFQPYVGKFAFAHKAGYHTDGVLKNSKTYEHIDPNLVGNWRHFVASQHSGRKAIRRKAWEFGFSLTDQQVDKVLRKVRSLEALGYHFEVAEGSLELLIRGILGKLPEFFRIESYRVIIEKENGDLPEATVKVWVGNKRMVQVAEGDGPVNALDNALRKALLPFYSQLSKIELVDYKVRVLNAQAGTAARVRVLIETSDGKKSWGTIGVSENIIEASAKALADSIIYGLIQGKD